jgi:hypothetical protein
LGSLGEATIQEIWSLISHLEDAQSGKIQPVKDLPSAFSALTDVVNGDPKDLIEDAIQLIEGGLMPANILDLLTGLTDSAINSVHNNNPRSPVSSIYPSKSYQDAPYSVDEATLRAAIYIPDTFQYGANGKRPVLLVPGTGGPGGLTYHFSFGKLLAGTTFADPVWLNIPGNSLGDVQVNAEYVAYAANYISGISKNAKIGLVSWSQGGLDSQWALKYWPSIRDVVDDFIPISPDFHGSTLYLPCPGFPSPLCTPAMKQQGYASTLIATLRANGGDSAYVPTTTLYSDFDEVVEPQSGTGATSYLSNAHGAGVTNNQIQTICPGRVAGSVYDHETMLLNPLSWALMVDALTHDGPGEPSRVNLEEVCGQLLAPGLSLEDFLGTEASLIIIVVNTLIFAPKVTEEPPIMAYAT